MNKIEVAFNQFLSSIKPNIEFETEVSRRREAIVSAINSEFTGSNDGNNSIFVGSYGRKTATKHSDIDLAVILSDKYRSRFDNYAHNGQSALLQSVKAAILDQYPRTDVEGDGQIVSVHFSDGSLFEVLPAFKKGLYDSRLCYADTHNGGMWKTTDPRSEIDAISKLNNLYGRQVYDVCRAMRIWNIHNNVGMAGYSIDAVVCDYFKHSFSGILNYSGLFISVFEFMYVNRFRSCWSMVGSGEGVSLTLREGTIEQAHEQIAQIELASAMGLPHRIIGTWGDVFGPDFPTE